MDTNVSGSFCTHKVKITIKSLFLILNTNDYDISDVLWLYSPYLWLISTTYVLKIVRKHLYSIKWRYIFIHNKGNLNEDHTGKRAYVHFSKNPRYGPWGNALVLNYLL